MSFPVENDWQVKMDQDIAESKTKIAILLEEELLDDDGYPTDAALEIVRLWHWSDTKGWFEFVKSIWFDFVKSKWHLNAWGWSEGLEPHDYLNNPEVYRYHISTGGWSGNESIIAAMQENDMLWSLTWVQGRRGGHYIFEGKEL